MHIAGGVYRTLKKALFLPSLRMIQLISVGNENELNGKVYASVWEESNSCKALMFINPTIMVSWTAIRTFSSTHLPRSTSLPSLTPPSVTSSTEPCGSWRAPECKSSFLLSGENDTLFRVPSERGRVLVRGRSSDKMCERAGVGMGVASSSEGFATDGIGGEGNCASVSDGDRRGGLRDCLWKSSGLDIHCRDLDTYTLLILDSKIHSAASASPPSASAASQSTNSCRVCAAAGDGYGLDTSDCL